MEQSKAHMSFMSLSPELRNYIYELTAMPANAGDGGVNGELAICVQRGMVEVDEVGSKRYMLHGFDTDWMKQPAITRVSRQVRAEALPMYYGANTFVAYKGVHEKQTVLGDQARDWLARIGASHGAIIKHLEIRQLKALEHMTSPAETMAAFNPKAWHLAETSVGMYEECEQCGWHEHEDAEDDSE